MKKLTLSLSLLCAGLAFSACQKDNAAQDPPSENSKVLVGTWELRKTRSMFVTSYPPGNGNLLRLDDSTYTRYANGQLSSHGKYHIITDHSVSESVCLQFSAGQFVNRLVYDSNYQQTKVFFQASHDSLTLVSGCFAYDAGAFLEYTRKQ